MVSKRAFVVLPVLLLVAACSSARRTYDPPISAENDVVRIAIQKSQRKKDDLRVWMTIENKTDDAVTVKKGSYVAMVNGKKYMGYAGHGIKITRGWDQAPNSTKKMKIAYVGVPEGGGEAELVFDDITVPGGEQAYRISVTIPYGKEKDEDDEDEDEGKGEEEEGSEKDTDPEK